MLTTRSALLALALVLGTACATTSVESAWKDPSATPVRAVLVVALTGSDATRRTFEQEMTRELGRRGVRAVALSERIPDFQQRTDRAALREEVRALVEREGFDAVLAGELLGKRTQVEYVPGGPMGFYTYWDAAFPVTYEPGYVDESTEYRVETRLFEGQGDAKLVWSLTSRSLDPTSARELADELVPLVVDRLDKDGLLGTSPAS